MRTEVTWPEAEARRRRPGPSLPPARDGTAPPGRRRPAPLPPHPEAARFLRAVTLGQPLAPVAQLRTVRERTELRTSDGRSLAEIDHDSVTGRALPCPPGGPRRLWPAPVASGPGADQEIRFVEVEVELAEGSSQEVLDAVAHRLRLAGARPSARQSKLATVLRMASLATPAPPTGTGGTGGGLDVAGLVPGLAPGGDRAAKPRARRPTP